MGATNGMQPEVQIDLVQVTPELAREYLGLNTHNRPIRKRTVTMYATDMREGNWKFTGGVITITKDGVINDGQHRLLAIIEADSPQWFIVVTGVEDVWELTDINLVRQFSDYLSRQGIANARAVAALARHLYGWQAGENVGTRHQDSMFASTKPSMSQLKRFYEENENRLAKAVHESKPVYVKLRGAAPSTYALAYSLFDALDMESNAQFWHYLSTGEGLPSDSPILRLRDTLARWNTIRDKPRTGIQLALFIKAWNAWQRGDSMKQLVFRPATEAFPDPIVATY